MIRIENLEKKIVKRITEYIGFDVQELFDQGDYITIYGGAVRDSIADLKIHDIDILCMPRAAKKLKLFLEGKNYLATHLVDPNVYEMYKDITLIDEPITLMNNGKIIQLIRPRYPFNKDGKTHPIQAYEKSYHNLIYNVDLTCCGVFLEFKNSKFKLKQACENAIVQCLNKCFFVNINSKLYTNRTVNRIYKLTDRGWYNFNDNMNSVFDIKGTKIKKERTFKLNILDFNIENNDVLDFQIPNTDQYKPKKVNTNLDMF